MSRQSARFVNETAGQYVPRFDARLYYRRYRHLRDGDQIPFLQQGYPAVRFTEVHEDYRHQHQDIRVHDGVQYGDLLPYVEPDYVARMTQVNVAALAAPARGPRSPGRAASVPSRLTNDTDLRWDANPEPDLSGDEVLRRDTTEPTWTHSRFVGNVTSYTVEGLSKDNAQFGIRAVDEQGHRSPVGYPSPASRPPLMSEGRAGASARPRVSARVPSGCPQRTGPPRSWRPCASGCPSD
ncbi:hypothetical protein GCM10009733_030910 [Nonomuraea maheshkhaliensis]|uniref:Fibronectin type-III domain-containing protein n=1 Tax=Nonomuraea maheshkhaliensis TaxID=419590 RepID=A0ABN2F5L9_9ACTN